MLAKEPFGTRSILLPAFSKPGADGPLDPELRVTQEMLEQAERSVEVAHPNPIVKRIGRRTAAPDVRGPGPAQKFTEAARFRGDHASDRPGRQAIGEGPTGRGVDPTVRESEGSSVVPFWVEVQ